MYDNSQRWTIPCCDSKRPSRIIHRNVSFAAIGLYGLLARFLVFANKVFVRDNSGGFNRLINSVGNLVALLDRMLLAILKNW